MKNKIKNSTKILLLSLLVLGGLFSVSSITARADSDDDEDHEYRQSRYYEREKEYHEDEEDEDEDESRELRYYIDQILSVESQEAQDSYIEEIINPVEEYYFEEVVEDTPTTVKEDQVVTQVEINRISDSDNDGVPDLEDKHPGEDDLIYAVKDINEDGVVDDFNHIVKLYGNIQ